MLIDDASSCINSLIRVTDHSINFFKADTNSSDVVKPSNFLVMTPSLSTINVNGSETNDHSSINGDILALEKFPCISEGLSNTSIWIKFAAFL